MIVEIDEKTKETLLKAQKNEIIEYHIYKKLAKSEKNPHNKQILENIADVELKHYNIWKEYTQEDVKPSKWRIWKYQLISKIFGLTFGLKLMERGEGNAQEEYEKLSKIISDAESIIKEEEEHENALIELIDAEHLRYISSMVLGINDALVELTGALAGLTFAFQDTRLIALTGLITGIAAALSMGSSEYLSIKSEESTKKPGKAALYTGFAYFFTVLFLVFPFLIHSNYYFSLGFTIVNAILVIFIFNYYICVTKNLSFKKRFLEMTLISLGIAALSFGIGVLLKIFFNI